MEIKFFKKSDKAKLPCKTKRSNNPKLEDTGYDIFGIEDVIIPAKGSAVVPTGIDVAYITPGYWFRVEARSGLSFKYEIVPHFGVVDNPYRGDLGIKLYNFSDKDYQVKSGDKIAQLAVYEIISADIEWSDTKDETHRGINGFGSTGR